VFFKDRKAGRSSDHLRIPLLPLRDLVVFPHMVVPLIVGRHRSKAALEQARRADQEVLLVTQRDGQVTDPGPDDLYDVGCVATIIQMMKLPDDNLRVLVEGRVRARIDRHHPEGESHRAEVSVLLASEDPAGPEDEALVRSVRTAFEQYLSLNKNLPPELLLTVGAISDAGRLADTLIAQFNFKLSDRQALLEQPEPHARLEVVLEYIQNETEILQVERKIKTRVKKQMEKSQKEYYLNEQMQAIQRELGEKNEFKAEFVELEQRIRSKNLTSEAQHRLARELRKLRMMSPMSAEATVVRNYVDWVLSLPWQDYAEETTDLRGAAEVLDTDHHGLRDVKDRILEHLAVAGLVKSMQGPVLCLVGPPGVGKTSLARSVARATGRDFVRQALGGVRDEAEIRGHRRTYIGALPGKIIQSLKKAGTSNPVFLLDEVDKMSTDFRGDPSSALLEVLDPEQNATFSDHYLDLDYDLSRVLFICTANSLQGIPAPLQDRLEIIRLPGYTEREKLAIARRYLIPKQFEANGLTPAHLQLTWQAVERVVREYTREAGVRNLDRELAKIFRKVAKRVVWTEGLPSPAEDAEDPSEPLPLPAKQCYHITQGNVHKLLGIPRFTRSRVGKSDVIGLVKGLAVTPWGGEVLEIEVAILPGKGKLILTGRLGDWLKESATAGFSYVRSRADRLGLEPDFHETSDLHIHYPGNSLRTDGPSAGIAMSTALTSALTGVPVCRDLAMTGEVSLRGRVLPIGGLKEKVLAAHQHGLARVLIPAENAKDIPDIPEAIREQVTLIEVEHMDEVLRHALRWPEEGAALLADSQDSGA